MMMTIDVPMTYDYIVDDPVISNLTVLLLCAVMTLQWH